MPASGSRHVCGCHEFLPCMHKRDLGRLPEFDKVSRYSATRCHAAHLIVRVIKAYAGSKVGTMLDAFGGSGSDAAAFLMSGVARRIDVTEIDAGRADAIEARLSAYAEDAGLPRSSFRVLNRGFEGLARSSYDVVFMDPPWGGPEYRTMAAVTITVARKPLGHWVRSASASASLVVVKIPRNYDHAKDPDVSRGAAAMFSIESRSTGKPSFHLVVHLAGHHVVHPSSSAGLTRRPSFRTESGPFLARALRFECPGSPGCPQKF